VVSVWQSRRVPHVKIRRVEPVVHAD